MDMDNSSNKFVGERILEIINDCNISQIKFSKIIGFSRSHLNNVLSNKACPSDRFLLAICYKFNISLEWLKNGTGEKFKNANYVESDYVINIFNDLSESSKQTVLKVLETFLKADSISKKD